MFVRLLETHILYPAWHTNTLKTKCTVPLSSFLEDTTEFLYSVSAFGSPLNKTINKPYYFFSYWWGVGNLDKICKHCYTFVKPISFMVQMVVSSIKAILRSLLLFHSSDFELFASLLKCRPFKGCYKNPSPSLLRRRISLLSIHSILGRLLAFHEYGSPPSRPWHYQQ